MQTHTHTQKKNTPRNSFYTFRQQENQLYNYKVLHNLRFILNKILKFLINNVQKLKYQSKRLLNVTSKHLMLIALNLTTVYS